MEDLRKALSQARKRTDKNPTEKQKEAGNYAKGRVTIDGFKIVIENPKGSYRRGTDDNGREWKVRMNTDYGYFSTTKGKDGDEIDVMIGTKLKTYKDIFVVDQYSHGKFDEHKVMLGFATKEDAKKAYMSNYEKGWKGFGKITAVSKAAFAKWLEIRTKKRKPFSEYAKIEEMKRMNRTGITESRIRNAVDESLNEFLTEVNWGEVGNSAWNGVKNVGNAIGKVANGVGGAVQGIGGAVQGAGDAVAAWGANKRYNGAQNQQQTQQQQQRQQPRQQQRGLQQQRPVRRGNNRQQTPRSKATRNR